MLDDTKWMSYITAGDQISFDLSRSDVEAGLIVGQGRYSHDAEMSRGPEGIVTPVMGENHEDSYWRYWSHCVHPPCSQSQTPSLPRAAVTNVFVSLSQYWWDHVTQAAQFDWLTWSSRLLV